MKREDVDTKVKSELEHIPKWPRPQNMLRMAYNAERRHHLAADAMTPANQSLAGAVAAIRKNSPEFEPQYDQGFFAES